MITHDGHVDILTLDKLRRDSKRDFQFASELQIRHKESDDWEMEIDICAISAGQLLIGEAKSNDSLKSNKRNPAIVAERYRTMAEAMNASGVVFATYTESWDSTSLTAMDTEFAKNPYLRPNSSWKSEPNASDVLMRHFSFQTDYYEITEEKSRKAADLSQRISLARCSLACVKHRRES
jgi:hypothetical protein